MLKLIKWLAGLLVTLMLLIAVAAIILPRIVDPNDYRDEIATLVKEKTGRDLRLDGDLSLEVFPWLGIRTQGLSVSQPAKIGGDMVSVKTAQLRVKLLPLLSKRVEVDTVILEQPVLKLVTLKDGTDSFSGLGGEQVTESESTTEGSGAAVALVIQGLELTDGQLTMDNRQTGELSQVTHLNVITGNLIGDDLAELSTSGIFSSSNKQNQANDSISFNTKGQAQINTDTLAVTAKNIVANVILGGEQATQTIDVEVADVNVSEQQQVEASDISAKVIQGEQIIDLNVDHVVADQQQKIDLTGLNLELSGAQSLNAATPSATANLTSQRAEVANITVSKDDLNAVVSNLVVKSFIDSPNASGSLKVDRFNAANLLKELDIDFTPSDQKALRSVGISANFSGSLSAADIKDLVLELDDSKLLGSASVQDFEKPKIKFDLTLDQLNLDNYLPASESDEGSSSQAPDGSAALAVPMAVFKDVNANGRFKAKQLISGGLELNDIDVQVVSTPGNVTITPTANLYDGKLDGAIAFSEKQGGAQLRVKNKIDLVDLGKMFTAADITDQLSGIGTLALDLLVTEKDGVQSNEGTIKLFAKDGVIKGVDIKGIVDKSYNAYQQLKGREVESAEAGESKENDETEFAELLGTFYLKDFKITNNDFALKAPYFRLGGEGEINIEQQTLNYLVNFAVVNTDAGQGGEALNKLKGITIPIRLKGDLTAPGYSLDMKALYKGLVKNELNEKKGELLKEKYGIEEGDKLSTKDVLKQLLIKKAVDDDKPQEQATEAQPSAEEPTIQQNIESANNPEPVEQEKSKEQTKEEAKDDLKRKLIEGLFN